MTIHYSTSLDPVDWTRLAEIFVDAALGDRSPAFLEQTFRNSQVVVLGFELMPTGMERKAGLSAS
jgi:hypothetical protein